MEELLARYQGLVVALPQAESLTLKRDSAAAWIQRAKTLLVELPSDTLVDKYKVCSILQVTSGV